MDFYSLLSKDAEDSLLTVSEYKEGILRLVFRADALGGEEHTITIRQPVHLDMPPKLMLGSVLFGDASLLPSGYAEARNQGYGGDEDTWRVLKAVDDEANEFYAIYFGREILE